MPPLIYIHKGFSWYVPLALLNGKKFGDGIIYLGNPYGCAIARLLGSRSAKISSFESKADDFARIYRHHSELDVAFELFCIQRWFILAEFMVYKGLESCIYLDTDVLLTRRIDPEVEATCKFAITYTGYSAHTCIIHRKEGLVRFCNWVMDLYSTAGIEARLKSWHEHMVITFNGGGVSDMTLFHWFQKDHPDVLGDYPTIFGDSPFDVSLEETRGFQADEEGFKQLDWQAGIPFAIRVDGVKVPLATLHHQGRGKARISQNAAKLGGNARLLTTVGKWLDLLYRAGQKLFLQHKRIYIPFTK